jgi:hypothetical protein
MEMKNHKENFEAYLLSDIEDVYHENIHGKSYKELVDKYVLTMGVDFSHPMIIALCKKFDFPVLIIDPKIGSPQGVNILDKPYVNATFCRNDNHYFVLYPKEEKNPPMIIPMQPVLNTTTNKPIEIVIKCQIPFGNTLFIRGSGNGLSWDRGIPLTQINDDTWKYRLSPPLQDQDMEYKLLVNDTIWQDNANYKIHKGKVDSEAHVPHFTPASSMSSEIHDAPVPTTQITVKFDAGFGNKLFIRGNGPGGMHWEKGVELRNVGGDVWVFETRENFENFEYKILLNDQKWENISTSNHKIGYGKKEEIIPKF